MPWMVPGLIVPAPALWAPRENLKSRSRRGSTTSALWRQSLVEPGPRSPGYTGNARGVVYNPCAPGPATGDSVRTTVWPTGHCAAVPCPAQLAIVGSRIRSRSAQPGHQTVKVSLPRDRGCQCSRRPSTPWPAYAETAPVSCRGSWGRTHRQMAEAMPTARAAMRTAATMSGPW